jgi:hypothetical protein
MLPGSGGCCAASLSKGSRSVLNELLHFLLVRHKTSMRSPRHMTGRAEVFHEDDARHQMWSSPSVLSNSLVQVAGLTLYGGASRPYRSHIGIRHTAQC